MNQISSPQNLNIQPNNPAQTTEDKENKIIIETINNNLNSIDMINPKGLIKQNVKNDLGLNFKIFGNTFLRETQISPPEKIYFLSHNLRSNFEKKPKEEIKVENISSKYKAQNFEQISNNLLNKEKDFYRDFIDLNGNIGINDINVDNNISSQLRATNANHPYNYMQENSEFDINNNKMGIFLLLQQDGNSAKISNKNKNKISTSLKRCYEHQRRKTLKENENEIEQKRFISFISPKKSQIPSVLSKKRSLEDNINIKNDSHSLKQMENYLIEEENNLFEKYFNSFVPYFRGLIFNKKSNINDKILKLKEVLESSINTFRGSRKEFCELMKRIITPLNNNQKTNKLTTKDLIGRVIKYLENDFERKNFLTPNLNFEKKGEFISNYANKIIYTYFSNMIRYSKNQNILLWAKIYFYLRLGWKKECIKFINSEEGLNIKESGLREIKESLDDTHKINILNYNEFKRIIKQERKEDNPFKHACMIYITKIPEQLSNDILLEINDHLWFNLNLIYPKDNYGDLIKKENGQLSEINTSSNQDNNSEMLELIKLKDLQLFFKNNTKELLNLNSKSTNFTYIILLICLLKFKTALSFMIKTNMNKDAINYYLILKELGIYDDFEEINENIIKLSQESNPTAEKKIYQIFPTITNNIPALMIYIIFSYKDFIEPLSDLIIKTESFGVLDNYDKKKQLFGNYNMYFEMNNYSNIKNFNICLKEVIDKKTLIKLCEKIYEKLFNVSQKKEDEYTIKNNSNLNPLFNTFKDLKMLKELTGILINKSIELLNLKKPIITFDRIGNISINLQDYGNEKYFGGSLINNYFGALINDVNQLFIEKQNKKENLIQINQGNDNEKILELEREIENNETNVSLLKQLPIIENIYELIYINNFEQAFRLYMDNIIIVKVGFECQNQIELQNEFNEFFQTIFLKMEEKIKEFYSDILYLFVWLFNIELMISQKKGYINIIENLRNKGSAIVYISEKLENETKNSDLMKYNAIFKKIKNESLKIREFYQVYNLYES